MDAPESETREQASLPQPEHQLLDEFPVVEGRYQMTDAWSVELPGKFNRRIEDDSLVIWRPGLTLWIVVYGKKRDEPKEVRLSTLKAGASKAAFDREEDGQAPVLGFAYRLREPSADLRAAAFYSFAVGETSHVQMAIYFDDERDVALARAIWRSLEERVAQ